LGRGWGPNAMPCYRYTSVQHPSFQKTCQIQTKIRVGCQRKFHLNVLRHSRLVLYCTCRQVSDLCLLLSSTSLTCAWDSDGRLRLHSRSLTAGNSEHSLWVTPNSANLFSWRLAAVVAEAGPGSRFSASCVRFVLTSYTNGRTSDGASMLDGYGPPIRVIWSCVKCPKS
jgi:hypothetical protein